MDGIHHNQPTDGSATTMNRRTALRGFGSLGLTTLLIASTTPAIAQDATPPAEAAPITFQLMGSGPTISAPGLELTLRRTMLSPGAVLTDHTHPGALVIFVESGAFGYTPLGGVAQLMRGTPDGAPGTPETMTMGAEVILDPGDWLFVEDPQDAFRNASDDDTVLLVAGLTRIGEPFTTMTPGMDMSATPTS